jgi:thiopeptide-type bacteriocin biosynthesis protein
MKKFSSDNVHSKFVVRTPSLPLQIDNLSEEYLNNIFKNPHIKEAIYIASPFLYSELEKLYSGEIKDSKKKHKLIISFAKYCSRMQSRCTPYGLFASSSTGTFTEKTKIVIPSIDDKQRTIRHTRPDMNFLCEFSQDLTLNSNIRRHLKFYPNSSIYRIGDQLRYNEYKLVNNKRLYQISSVSNSDYLELVLANSASGCNINEIAELLISEEISLEEALDFINELIDNQILISELEPNLTGPEFIYYLVEKLSKINTVANEPEIISAIQLLTDLQNQLDEFDVNKVNSTSLYNNIFSSLKPKELNIKEGQLIQIDLFKNSETSELSHKIKEDLVQAFNFLNKLLPASDNGSLKQFKEAFYKRYEEEEVSLLEVLDSETGIGFPTKDTSGTSSLIDDLNTNQRNSIEPILSWKRKDQLLFQKYLSAYKNGSHTIQIDDSEINNQDSDSMTLPHTFSVVFRVLNEKGQLQVLNWGSSSAANILGRFAHGSKEIESIISDVVAFEKKEMPGKIIAEIVHLPYGRLGNILLRPVFREYEIPYLAKSILDSDHQISLSDLYVSLKNDKIILRSKRLNKEIIPRLTTAHNFLFNTLPLYQFLGELQGQYFEKRNLNFDWGMVDSIAKFLPRVEYKNVILSAAKWKLNKGDLASLISNEQSSSFDIKEWRLQHNLPEKIMITEDDNELLINFTNELSTSIFIDFIKKKNEVTLTEFLHDEKNMLVSDKNGNKYTNECIAIFFTQNKQPLNGSINLESIEQAISSPKIKRQFIVGDEWVYYKLYCGIKSADKILTESIKPLIKEFTKNDEIDDWFFIRYADPDWHIRLRLRVKNLNEIGKIINSIRFGIENFILSGLISKVEISNYNRELERYDFHNILIAEKYFCLDSEATVNFLEIIDQQDGDKFRLQFAAKSIDDLLTAFQLNDNDKLAVMELIQSGFVKEHGGEELLKVQLDNKFRLLRKEIEYILSIDTSKMTNNDPLINILRSKREKADPLIKQLLENFKLKSSSTPIIELISSYIHMSLNRIFYSRQRTHEMLMYYLLYKHYKSTIAMKNKKVSQFVLKVD